MAKSNKNSVAINTLKSKEDVVDAIAAGTISQEDALTRLAQLEAAAKSTIYCKVSQKGALSVYGLQRMPVTLYVGQWDRVFASQKLIEEFAKEHKDELSQGRNDKKDYAKNEESNDDSDEE